MESKKEFPRINAPQKHADQSAEGVKSLTYADILQKSFVYILVGEPGSGKSHLVSEMILREDMYFKKFNKVVYITPSRLHPDLSNDSEFYSPILDEEFLEGVISRLTQVTIKHPEKQFNFLFVLDDCVAALKNLGENSIITNLFFNRRHLIPNGHISIIVTTQEFKAVSSQVRSVATGLFLFTPTPEELETLEEEYVFDKEFNAKAVEIVRKYFTQSLFEFLYIETHPRVELFYNFLKVY